MAAAPNPHELLRSTTGKANFQRIARLLIVGGTAVMREIFENNLPAPTLSEALSNPATERLLIAKLNKQQLNCVYPSPGVCGNSEDFDISLFFQLLITVCKLIPSGTSFEDLTSTTDNSLARNLLRIKIFRNQVAHVNQNMEISNDDFPSLWQNISNAILEIAAHISPAKRTEWQDAIDDFLSRPLTPEAEKYEQELMTCYQSIEDLKTRVEELQEAVARFEALSSRPDNQPFGG